LTIQLYQLYSSLLQAIHHRVVSGLEVEAALRRHLAR
jgi:hypothetical protein